MDHIKASHILCIFLFAWPFAAADEVTNSESEFKPPANCTAARDVEADLCTQRSIVIGDRSRSLPKTQAEVRTFCRDMATANRCVRQYANDCMERIQKQIFNAALTGLKRTTRRICRSKIERDEMLEVFKCITPTNFDLLHRCMETGTFQSEEQILATFADDDQIPAGCCVYHLIVNCVTSVTSRRCAPYTDPFTAIDWYLNQLDSVL